MHVNLSRVQMVLNQFLGIKVPWKPSFLQLASQSAADFHHGGCISPRFTTGHTCTDDSWHHRLPRRSGCGMYGNEVHHLRRKQQSSQVSHCHDWRDYLTRWGWECVSTVFGPKLNGSRNKIQCFLTSKGSAPSWRAPGSHIMWSGPSIIPTRRSTPSKWLDTVTNYQTYFKWFCFLNFQLLFFLYVYSNSKCTKWMYIFCRKKMNKT